MMEDREGENPGSGKVPPFKYADRLVDVGTDPEEVRALADAIVRGEVLEYKRIKDLRAIVDAVMAHPDATLAPVHTEREKHPLDREAIDALTKVVYRWCVIETDGARFYGLNIRCTLVCYESFFGGIAGFESATFSGDAQFESAVFGGKAEFSRATFEQPGEFIGTHFCGAAEFVGATFSSGARFDPAVFHRTAAFGSVCFGGVAVFTGGAFCGDARFEDADFNGDVKFEKSTFGRIAGFSEVRFDGDAGFEGTHFVGNAWFDFTIFRGSAWFVGTVFGADARFELALFEKYACFWGTHICGDACFNGVNFGGDAGFDRARFVGSAVFFGAGSWGRAGFNFASFGGGAAGDLRRADVRHVIFGEAAAVAHGGESAEEVRWWRSALRDAGLWFGWHRVRALGELAILNRVSLVALIAVPLIAGVWKLVDVAVKSMFEVEENPVSIGASLVFAFFAAMFVTLGRLVYQVFAPPTIQKFDEDAFVDDMMQRYTKGEGVLREDGLRRATEALARIAGVRPDRHANLVSHHGETVWIPPKEQIEWFQDPDEPDEPQEEGASEEGSTERDEKRTPARQLPGFVPGEERARIALEEGARAEYWLLAREVEEINRGTAAGGRALRDSDGHVARGKRTPWKAVLALVLYVVGVGCLLVILGLQSNAVMQAGGWPVWVRVAVIAGVILLVIGVVWVLARAEGERKKG